MITKYSSGIVSGLILLMTGAYVMGQLNAVVEFTIYMSAILYAVLGFGVINIVCTVGKNHLHEMMSEYGSESLIELSKDGKFSIHEFINILSGLVLIYFGGHYLAMSIYSLLIINKIIKMRINVEISNILLERGEVKLSK